jgi:hypothetical protein
VQADAFALPFASRSFERAVASHFLGHLQPGEAASFLAETARVAPELVVADSALNADTAPEAWQERVLLDGSRYRIDERWFTPAGLLAELGGRDVLFAGHWFLAVRHRTG